MDCSTDTGESARFIAALAHEARGNLNEIGLATSLSRRALDAAQTTRVRSQLDRIEERVRDIAAVLDDLQDLMGESVERSSSLRIACVAEIVEAALAPVRSAGHARGIAVTQRSTDETRVEIDVARARRLTQLAANGLLSFGRAGTLELRAESVSLGVGQRAVTIELRRRPASDAPSSAEGSRATEVVLTRLARALQATVGPATVEAGLASRRLTLPARLVSEATPEPALEGHTGSTLLVVEDDEDARAALVLLLEDWGFQVLEAATGEAVAAIGLTAGVRLALLDIELPGVDGFAVRDALRERFRDLPVVFLSGSERHMTTGDQGPMTRFLMKPVELGALESALRDLLDDSQETFVARSRSAATTPRDPLGERLTPGASAKCASRKMPPAIG